MGNTNSNKQPKTSLITAITTGKKTMSMLQKKLEYNEKRVAKELEKAREYKKTGNNQQALRCLKRKKMIKDSLPSFG